MTEKKPDKPIYRKSKSVNRVFFKIDGAVVTKVVIKQKVVSIETAEHWIATAMATDEYTTVPSFEEEFKTAYNEAITTCTLMKIL